MPYKDPAEQRKFQRIRAATRRAEEVERRGGKCIKCGSTLNLEFHHRNPQTKKDHKVWSWTQERREAELKKCDLLCKKCHDVETAKERGYGIIVHGSLFRGYQNGCRCPECRRANADYERARRLRIRGKVRT
jgi:5-methylcytosine-specific restriction endonuclease McrA